MKKQFSFLLLSISSLALVGLTALSGVKITQAKGDLSTTTWKHFDAVEATYETRGIKEYWTDCIGGQPVFEKPVDVSVNEGGIPSEAFISSLAIDDSRLIPAFKEYSVLSSEHAIKYVLASDDSETTLSSNDESDNRYGNVYSFDFSSITGNKNNYAYMEVSKEDILNGAAIYVYSDANMLVGYGDASSDGYAIKANQWNKVKLTKEAIEAASDSRFYFFSSSVDSLNKLGTIKVTNFVQDITSNDDMLTVTWKNDDGSILAIDNVKEGEIPSYKNGIPSKETSEKVYEFTGWDKEISAVKGNTIYTAQFNDGYAYKAGFININGTLNMSEETLAGEEAVHVTGTGHVGFKGAYLPADTFFDNYTYLVFDFMYKENNTDNMMYTTGVSQWFRADGVANNLNNDFFRVFDNGVLTQTIIVNHWYSVCYYVRSSLDNGTTPALKDIRLELNSYHNMYLKNLRFGNKWMYSLELENVIQGQVNETKELPSTFNGKPVTYISNNAEIVEINDNVATLKKVGFTTVTASFENGATKDVSFRVINNTKTLLEDSFSSDADYPLYRLIFSKQTDLAKTFDTIQFDLTVKTSFNYLFMLNAEASSGTYENAVKIGNGGNGNMYQGLSSWWVPAYTPGFDASVLTITDSNGKVLGKLGSNPSDFNRVGEGFGFEQGKTYTFTFTLQENYKLILLCANWMKSTGDGNDKDEVLGPNVGSYMQQIANFIEISNVYGL